MAHPIKHFRTITRHRHKVIANCARAGILRQGLIHDLSKYSPTEFIPGAKYFSGHEKSQWKGKRTVRLFTGVDASQGQKPSSLRILERLQPKDKADWKCWNACKICYRNVLRPSCRKQNLQRQKLHGRRSVYIFLQNQRQTPYAPQHRGFAWKIIGYAERWGWRKDLCIYKKYEKWLFVRILPSEI